MYYKGIDTACRIGGLTPKPKANADISAEWRVGSVIISRKKGTDLCRGMGFPSFFVIFIDNS